MKNLHLSDEQKIWWHLSNNVLPSLNPAAIDGVIKTLNQVRNGEKKLDDTINNNTDCTCGEMIDDLRLSDYISSPKTFHVMHNVGKVKYLLSYHDGIKSHKDGSKFFDVACFSNKKELAKEIKQMIKDGYIEQSFQYSN